MSIWDFAILSKKETGPQIIDSLCLHSLFAAWDSTFGLFKRCLVLSPACTVPFCLLGHFTLSWHDRSCLDFPCVTLVGKREICKYRTGIKTN